MDSGRSRPSRGMVIQLAQSLEVPLRDCNALLRAAGFSAQFRQRPLNDSEMAPVREALDLILKHHEPYPAIVIDRHWNMVDANAATARLFAVLGDDVWQRIGSEQPNTMRLTFHRLGLRPLIKNWNELAPLLLQRLQREAVADDSEPLKALLAELADDPEIPENWIQSDPGQALAPVLPMHLEWRELSIRLFSMISTFGTAQDVTAEELRVESFFPMDEETARQLQALQ